VLHEQAHGENTVEAATLNINLGAALLAAGESAESKRHFQTALDIRCKHLGEEHQQTQAAMKWLAKLQSKNDQTSRPPSATPTPEGLLSSPLLHSPSPLLSSPLLHLSVFDAQLPSVIGFRFSSTSHLPHYPFLPFSLEWLKGLYRFLGER